MNVELRPEMEQFVDDQVKAGRFSSPAEVLEAGIARLMLDPEPDVLDAGVVAELRESLAGMRRGEVVDRKEQAVALRERYLGE